MIKNIHTIEQQNAKKMNTQNMHNTCLYNFVSRHLKEKEIHVIWRYLTGKCIEKYWTLVVIL